MNTKVCRKLYDRLRSRTSLLVFMAHDDVIKWKHFPRCWLFVPGIHRSPVNSPHKGQWRGALMCPFICAWINSWVNNGEAGDLRRHSAHYDVTAMYPVHVFTNVNQIHLDLKTKTGWNEFVNFRASLASCSAFASFTTPAPFHLNDSNIDYI